MNFFQQLEKASLHGAVSFSARGLNPKTSRRAVLAEAPRAANAAVCPLSSLTGIQPVNLDKTATVLTLMTAGQALGHAGRRKQPGGLSYFASWRWQSRGQPRQEGEWNWC
jgi:hypothetical protein